MPSTRRPVSIIDFDAAIWRRKFAGSRAVSYTHLEIIHANVVRSAAKEYTPITTRADISAYLEGGAGACPARAVRRREVVR